MDITENEIQGLKAQEAKDLAVELLQELHDKEKSPVSAGAVQLQELEYDLKLKEAELEDNRQREVHETRIKELELKIAQEQTRQAEERGRAEAVRVEHAQLVEQVSEAKESLSLQLERATREHKVRIENLEANYKSKSEELESQLEELETRRETLRNEIGELVDLRETVEGVVQLHEEIESSRKKSQQELHELEEEFAALEFDKNKKINEVKRKQELAITELETEHKKSILQANQRAAEEILSTIGKIAVNKEDWNKLQRDIRSQSEREEGELNAVREQAQAEFRNAYNITSPDILDVTELFYNHQATRREADALQAQAEKLETEIRRMRGHIEHEPQRIAVAVEAAKVQVQNTIEQASGR